MSTSTICNVMLQKEVVERIAAAPGSGSYGRLTVMLAPGSEAGICSMSARGLQPTSTRLVRRGAPDRATRAGVCRTTGIRTNRIGGLRGAT
jgi:hypothetical protein